MARRRRYRNVTPSFVGAQWYRVVPFAMTLPDQFRSFVAQFGSGFVRFGDLPATSEGSDQHQREPQDEQKMIAEVLGNGRAQNFHPAWTICEFVSRRDHHTVDDDAKCSLP